MCCVRSFVSRALGDTPGTMTFLEEPVVVVVVVAGDDTDWD